jgi:hypothetical protein
LASTGWNDGFKTRCNIVCRTRVRWEQECWSRNTRILEKLPTVVRNWIVIYIMLMRVVYFSFYNIAKPSLFEILSPHCFKNVKRLPTKYEANTNSCMTTELFKTRVFERCLTQLDRKLVAKNHRILLFIYHCATHPQNTTFLNNVKVLFLPANCTCQLQPLDLGTIHAFKCHYRN